MNIAATVLEMTTVQTAIRDGAARLTSAGVPNPALDARLLAGAALRLTREALVAQPDRVLSEAEAARLAAMVERRAAREPVSRILGRREFWSLAFEVTPATLDPRPDSETLIEAALEAFPQRNRALSVVDLGTSTGCLLLAFLSEYPNASGIGVDISPEAINVASRNAARLGFAGDPDTGLGARACFMVGDWDRSLVGSFDCLFANPPYISTDDLIGLAPEVGHDPRAALDGGSDGLNGIMATVDAASRLLRPGGRAFVEIGAGQDQAAREIATAAKLQVVEVRADMGGIPRVLELVA